LAEGWKRSGVFNSLSNDEITFMPIAEATTTVPFFFLQCCAHGMTYGTLTGNFMPIFELL
jgi:hypothetical protein